MIKETKNPCCESFFLNAIPHIHQCKSVTRIDVSAFQSPFNLLRTANIWRSEQLLSQHETHRRHTVNYVALRIPLNLVFLGTAIPIWMAHFEPCLSFERILPKLFYQKEKRQTSLRTYYTKGKRTRVNSKACPSLIKKSWQKPWLYWERG